MASTPMARRNSVVLLALAFSVAVVAFIGIEASVLVETSFRGSANALHATAGVAGILSYLVGITVFPGVITYLLIRRDLHGWRAALVTAGCVILVGVGSWFGFVFVLFAFFVAAGVHAVMRRLFRFGPALTASAMVLVGGIVGCVFFMKVALDGMG